VRAVVEEPKTWASQVDDVHLEEVSSQALRPDVAGMESTSCSYQYPETGLERMTIGSNP